MSEFAPLAIVGISCLFPKADDLQAYWRNIKNGVDAIAPLPERSHWNESDYFNQDPKAPDQTYAKRGGFLSPLDFNPMEFGIAPKDVEATDTTQLLGMVAAKQALVDAGYGERPFNKERTSVILGVTGALELVIPLGARLGHPLWRRALKEAGVAQDIADDVVQRISDGYVGWQENSFPGLLGNVAAGRIASRLDLGGTNCVVDAACASSLAALHLAALELSAKKSDMVITGGIDTFNDIFMYMCFSKTPALSPTGDAKPFDRQCDGTILGEGIGMVVLKRLEDAERDGDRVYCVIKGLGSSSDGRGNAIYAPRADGQKIALRRAYESAGVAPSTIRLIEAHGTGTKVGDATEVQSLSEVFRGQGCESSAVALGSVKSQIGHTKAAAGVAGLIKAAMALHNKVLPPTIKVTQPLDELAPGTSPFYVNTQKRPWLPDAAHPRRAATSSFGFGGTNFHCVLEERESSRATPDWDGDIEILAFCAGDRESLRAAVAALPDQQDWNATRRQAHASRASFRSDAAFRLLVPLARTAGIGTTRDAILLMLDRHLDKPHWVLPNGAAFAAGPKRGKLGALFPGQGSQYVGMLRDLACQFPVMLDSLAAADRVFQQERPDHPAKRLTDFIYPPAAFGNEARAAHEEALKSTDIAQPALGAVGLGAMNVLAEFGITPEAAAGQSYGELLALCGAGRLKPESLHLLSNVRGRLMAAGSGRGDRGAMLTVQASEDAVTRFVQEENPGLVIANRNSPSQFVLAGPKPEIERAATQLAQRSVRAKVLKVSAAFHSSLVADACEPFAAVLETVPFSVGRIPVYANATAREYPIEAAPARELLTSQIVKPVDFIAQIEKMHADGITTFVEMGPGHVLSDLVQAILQGRDVATVALDASKGSRSGIFDLAAALCRVAALGHSVDLARWEPHPPKAAPAGKPALTIPLTGANYRSPKAPRPPRLQPAAAPVVAAAAAAPVTPRVDTPAPVPVAAPKPSVVPVSVPTPQPAPSRPVEKPASPPAPASASVPRPQIAIGAAEQGILALQKLQEQTAQLHRQFLENQDAARRTLESILTQRRDRSTAPTLATIPPAVVQPVAPVAPVVVPQPTPAPARIPAPTPAAAIQAPAPAIRSAAPAVAVAPAPSPAPKPKTAPGLDPDRIATAVLDVVAEKTGYPAEMLNLDMGLDSDLGVDSIKRVEIMAALRGKLPGAPEVKPEHLGTLQTLREVVRFLAPQTTPSPASAPSTQSLPSTSPAAASVSVSAQRASEALLGVVAEKTGYPVEMLNLDMGLDSDLGVDSIKRVEIMAALRTLLPEAPEVRPEHLGTLQSLRQIVDFLSTGNPASANQTAASTGPASPASQAPNEPNSGVNAGQAEAALLQVVAEKTGYPPEMLNLDMGLDSDLGIDSIKRVEIMAALRGLLPGAPEIKPEHLGSLQTLGEIVRFLSAGVAPQPVAPAPTAAMPATTATPETAAPDTSASAAPAWAPVERQVVRPVRFDFHPSSAAAPANLAGTVLISDDDTSLGAALEKELRTRGCQVERAPLSELLERKTNGAVAGLVIVWPEREADDAELKTAFQLVQLHAAALRHPSLERLGVLGTISRLDGVFGFNAATQAVPNPISGGLAGISKTARHEWPEVRCRAFDFAGSIDEAPAAAALFVHCLLTEAPVEIGYANGEALALHIETAPVATNGAQKVIDAGDVVIVTGGARGVTATATLELARAHRPRLVLLGRTPVPSEEPDWLSSLSGEAVIKKALISRNAKLAPKQLESAYREVMAQREIRTQLQQLAAVGAPAVYRALDVRDPAQVFALFRSVREEFGAIRGIIHGAGVLADRRIEDKTAEQFDLVYDTKVAGLRHLLDAASDEPLKLVALFSSYTGRFGRTGQVDYAAANEVLNKLAQRESRIRPDCRVVAFNWGPWNGGMVSDGLRKIFEAEGVGLIEPQAGAEFFLNEVASHAERAVEVLAIALAGSATLATPTAQPDPGLVALKRDVSVEAIPCLQSHVLLGKAVVPAALLVEWLAEGALQNNPGLRFSGLENFRVLKGVVLEQPTVTVEVVTHPARWQDGQMIVPTELLSHRSGRPMRHASADIVLAEHWNPAPQPTPFASTTATAAPGYYQDGRLFHGPHFQALQNIEAVGAHGILAQSQTAPTPADWIQNPCRGSWITDPLALDAAFQAMILWSWQNRGAACLPCGIKNLRLFTASFPSEGVTIAAHVAHNDESNPLVTARFEFINRQGVVLAVADGAEQVVDPSLATAFQRHLLRHEEQA